MRGVKYNLDFYLPIDKETIKFNRMVRQLCKISKHNQE